VRALAGLLVLLPAAAWAGPDGAALYREHCAECHGPERLGGQGPTLLPGPMRLDADGIREVIAEGRHATQMPAYGQELSAAEIDALAGFVARKPETRPRWDAAKIRASRSTLTPRAELPERPVHDAHPEHLFVVVEKGDHHLSILDGDSFERIARFPSRYALHGGPKFSPEGRYVYFASRDGWITKYDLFALEKVAEVRAGLNTRNIAISGDGQTLAVANYLPRQLVMLDARDLSLEKVIPARGRHGTPSRVSAVYQAPPRGSFIAALKDIPEIWEIPWGANPPPQYGFVHSHRKGMKEAIPAKAGRFPIRRIEVKQPLDDFFFGPDYNVLLGADRQGGQAKVVQLQVGRTIASLPLEGLPHLGSGISWTRDGTRVMATPHLRGGKLSVIDMQDYTVVKQIDTAGPGFFLRSHPKIDTAWVDVFFGPNHDKLHVIDKQSLEIVDTLQPAPGKTAAHVEFTHDGRYALVSVWEEDGAIVVYDTRTREIVRRIPMSKPSGKYNVANKIRFTAGTSH
jgi:cytochrome c553/DNA-binding beta-propeller fold protein YncE